jgi:hypothetical protein
MALGAVGLAIVIGGCGSNGQTAHGFVPVAAGYRVVSPSMGDIDTGPAVGATSPDGKWRAEFAKRNGCGNVIVTNLGSHRRLRVYHSANGCCTEIAWLPPHYLVFDDDHQVQLVDAATRQQATIAQFSSFVISPDGRWVAGYASSGGHGPKTVGVVPSTGGTCRTVPRTKTQDDIVVSFTPDSQAIRISRASFDPIHGVNGDRHLMTIPLDRLQTHGSC